MNIKDFRSICLSFPHVEEDIKWGQDLCFLIGGKMFAVTGLQDGSDCASLKVPDELFEELTARPGIVPAPYLARYKWVHANFEAMNDAEWKERLATSYDLVKAKLPAKILKSL